MYGRIFPGLLCCVCFIGPEIRGKITKSWSVVIEELVHADRISGRVTRFQAEMFQQAQRRDAHGHSITQLGPSHDDGPNPATCFVANSWHLFLSDANAQRKTSHSATYYFPLHHENIKKDCAPFTAENALQHTIELQKF